MQRERKVSTYWKLKRRMNHEKMRKFVSALLILTTLFCYCAVPATTAAAAGDDSVAVCQLVARWNITPEQCREMAAAMNDGSHWTDDIAIAVAEIIGGGALGGVTWLATQIKNMNYRAAKQALQNGAKSGKGCTMLIYDNAVPTIIQNY